MAYILTRKNPIVTETKTGSILTFNSALPVVADDVSSLISGYQEGSGTPAPDNMRNIVSFDEGTVSRTGVNIWNEEVEEGYIYNGRNYASTSYKRTKDFVPVKAGETYRFIGFTTDGQINCFDENKQYLRAFGMNNTFLYEMPERTCYIKFYNPNASFDSNCSINYPSTDTSYHSGKSNKYYTLSFGQSIYEGTIDFTTGVLTATWGYIASYNGETLSGEWISDRDEYVAGNSPTTGAEVAYELATPLEIQLMPTEISLLQDTNNMWSSTGNLTVQFQNVK